jgi:exopolysaccharide biosynthesis polyprenyl glycosylphosphotransferase
MSAMPQIGRIDPLATGLRGFDPGHLVHMVDGKTQDLLHRKRQERRGWLVRRSLAVADVVGLAVAFLIARLALNGVDTFQFDNETIAFVAMLPVWVLIAHLQGLYARDERQADNATADDVVGVLHLVTLGSWALLAGSILTGLAHPELLKLIAFWGIAICLIPVTRTLARALCRRTDAYLQNTLIVGAGDVGQLVARKLIRHPEYGINVVGFVDTYPKARRADLPEHLTILGTPENLHEIIPALDVERVVISFSNDSAEETLEILRQLSDLNVQVDLVPRLFELVGPKDSIHLVEGMPLVALPPSRISRVPRLVKRTIDIVVSGGALLALAPLMAFIAFQIRRTSPGPVFFRQTRLGQERREFTALKFRTMKVDTDTSLHQEYIRQTMSSDAAAENSGIYKLDRSDAVTSVGRWLRKTSLDELPQLINVLRGDMSLVGPRPCIPYETEHFKTHHFERFHVPQGLTGLWQVTARANSSFGEALDMDVTYVRGWSIGLDLRLMLRTPLQLLRQRGATA